MQLCKATVHLLVCKQAADLDWFCAVNYRARFDLPSLELVSRFTSTRRYRSFLHAKIVRSDAWTCRSYCPCTDGLMTRDRKPEMRESRWLVRNIRVAWYPGEWCSIQYLVYIAINATLQENSHIAIRTICIVKFLLKFWTRLSPSFLPRNCRLCLDYKLRLDYTAMVTLQFARYIRNLYRKLSAGTWSLAAWKFFNRAIDWVEQSLDYMERNIEANDSRFSS